VWGVKALSEKWEGSLSSPTETRLGASRILRTGQTGASLFKNMFKRKGRNLS